MAHQYAKIAFTETVRQVQREQNSRQGYASMDTGEDYNYLLSAMEAEFIAQRDSFYMASVSETDWPYVQHRGGPNGFLKVIDAQTIGFADYKGNRQYVSTGNFRTNDRVSIILMDYPNRRRLKILGHISQVDEQDWTTLAALEDNHYRARVERGFVIKISAFDWNCPQHITPRYNEVELTALLDPLQAQVDSLKSQLKLQMSANKKVDKLEHLGDGELSLVIAGIRQLTPEIRAYELRSADGSPLPEITAGAHIQVPVQLLNEQLVWRNYSISSNPKRTDCYEIAVKKEQQGQGGSQSIHQQFDIGLRLNCRMPENYFPLAKNRQHSVLIAAGVGITAIKSMALALLQQHASFELHYAGRSRDHMAYADRLTRQLADKLFLYPSNEGKKLMLKSLMSEQEAETHFYFCGPEAMLREYQKHAKALGINKDRLHFELFSREITQSSNACQLTLAKSKISIEVAAEQTLLDAVLAAGVDAPYSCTTGECKSCVVNVAENSEIEHLDECLTSTERANGQMCLCVSRPKSNALIIDL